MKIRNENKLFNSTSAKNNDKNEIHVFIADNVIY